MKILKYFAFAVIATASDTSTFSQTQRPNIVVFMADDLGRTDVSYTQGNLQTPTLNIDRLAWDGLTTAIVEGEPRGLPLRFSTQGNLFKQLGYQTWQVGKWHLGEHQRAYYPERRGFDYAYGITQGACNWFNYTVGWITPYPTSGRTFRENGRAIFSNHTNNVYFPELLTNKAEQLIRDANPSQPFYLYFTTPVPHTGYEPYLAVQHTMPQFQLRPPVFRFSDAFPERKKQLGIIQVLDESFKRVVDALVHKGVMNNTIVVFFSDNGAPMKEHGELLHGANHGVNWPLRLGKATYFEGGIRTCAFIWSPLLKKRGRITNQLFHVTDWLPTLWEAAGGDAAALPTDGDGYSHWPSFQGGLTVGPRKEIMVNINVAAKLYAIIQEDKYGTLYKLISGNVFDNVFLGWNRPEGTTPSDDSWRTYSPAEVVCNFPEGTEVAPCRPGLADCLFDITNDPCETNNIAAAYPAMLQLLQQKVRAYNATITVSGREQPIDPRSNPALWGGWWVPWLEANSGDILDAVPVPFKPFSPSSAF